MREEKQQMVKELGGMLEPAKGVVLINYKGLTVDQFSEVRSKLEEVDARCQVVPNRLLRRAATEYGKEEFAESIPDGDTAIVTAEGDPIQTVKCVNEFVEKVIEQALDFRCSEMNVSCVRMSR